MNRVLNLFQFVDNGAAKHLEKAACGAAALTVLALGLHLWPFEGRYSLEMIAPVNAGIILWGTAAVAMVVLSGKARQLMTDCLPDVATWTFLAVAAASLAFSPHVGQSIISLAKLALMYIGAFTLFGVACNRKNWPDKLCIMATISMVISLIASITWRLLGYEGFGFFANPHKHGTATAMLSVLALVFLASRQGVWAWIAVPLAALAAAGTASLGGLCGTLAGLVSGALLLKGKLARLRLVSCLLVVVSVVVMIRQTPMLLHLREDARVGEPNGLDLRQRYIEWQAQLTLIGQRPIAGTGLGCVNEYRSMFYGRLPKLNTLQPFEYNGWLLIAAETGILGLIVFVWLIAKAARRSRQVALAGGPYACLGATAFAAIAAACVANTFSFVNYNGVLNAFVFVLALAQHAGYTEPGASETEVVISARAASLTADRRCN